MAVIQATEIRVEGNVIYIKADPAIGILTLSSFTDTTTGVDSTHSFIKQFRYSANGVTWGNWQPLTNQNIAAISVSTTDTLVIEYSYTKVQPLGDDILQVTSVDVNVTEQEIVDGVYFTNSIFSQFFNSTDVNVLRWYVSVLEKLYEKGLLPSYIDRLNENNLPDDFVDFWKSIAKFFAYYVIYARAYQNFYENDYLLAEYLTERGLAISINNTLDELQYLMRTFYKQIFNRGTLHIIDEIADTAPVDGELLRLIYYKDSSDEFMFNLYKPEHFGWNLGNSSPLFKGMYLNDNVNKAYETNGGISDVSKYPVIGNVTTATQDNYQVLEVNANVSESGISPVGGLKYIRVDPSLDYQISFIIKKSAANSLKFGLIPYDKNGTQLSCKSTVDGSSTNFFLTGASLVRDDKYILVKAYIYNFGALYYNSVTDLNQGNNLVFPQGTVNVIPYITIDSGTANITALRMVPMQTPYSRGFLDTKNFISCWLKNNNPHFNINQIKDFVVRYLIPYNSNIALTLIGKNMTNSIPTTTTTTLAPTTTTTTTSTSTTTTSTTHTTTSTSTTTSSTTTTTTTVRPTTTTTTTSTSTTTTTTTTRSTTTTTTTIGRQTKLNVNVLGADDTAYNLKAEAYSEPSNALYFINNSISIGGSNPTEVSVYNGTLNESNISIKTTNPNTPSIEIQITYSNDGGTTFNALDTYTLLNNASNTNTYTLSLGSFASIIINIEILGT